MGVLPTCVCLVPEEARRGHQLSPLKLELQTVVSCHTGAGNEIRGLWKNSQCSQKLSHLSSPSFTFHFQYCLMLCAQLVLNAAFRL